MKVCFITNILAPYRIRLFAEIERLVDRLDVVLMARGHANRSWILPPHDFRIHVAKGIHIKLPHHEEPYHLNFDVPCLLRRLNPDAIVSGGFAVANVLGYLYARNVGCPHYTWGELTMTDGAERNSLRRWLRHTIVSGSTGAIGSSSAATDAFIHYGSRPESTHLSLMPIDIDWFKARSQQFRVSPEFALLKDSYGLPRLICVSRLVRAKGLHELFRSFSKIAQEYPEAMLLIAGDGPDRDELVALVHEQGLADRVDFLGFLQADELVKYYAIADVFVFPTLSDSFGAVLCEAMACGVPAVSSIHAAATQDLVENDVTGFTMDPTIEEEMTAALMKCLALTTSERERMVAKAYERVAETNFAATAQKMVTFLKRSRPL